MAELRARRAQDDKAAVTVRDRSASGSERSPRMVDVRTGDVRVHRAIQEVPYVSRDAEREVERALGLGHRRVLIIGASMAGKTRLALRVAGRLYPDHRLWEPKDGTALHGLLATGVTSSGLVIWLDDLERYLGPDGVTAAVLDRFHEQGNVVVATIRTAAYQELLPVGELRPSGWDAPRWFGEPVWLSGWSEGELERAAGVVTPEVLASARRYGLSAFVGGGPLAVDFLRTGREQEPVGYALVRAAADWRRVGLSTPISEQVLQELLPAYLDAITRRATAGADAVQAGLDWATTRVNETVALLEDTGDGYTVLEYALEYLSSLDTGIPQQLWDAGLVTAGSGDLLDMGYEALARHDRRDVAETAWRRSAETEPAAAVKLGLLLKEHGDLDGAVAAYQQAIDSAHPEQAAAAAYNLGMLEGERGDLEGAVAAYHQAIDSGHPEVAPMAAIGLGWLLAEHGKVDRAVAAYQQAIDSAHADLAPVAMVNLGMLLQEHGELDGAVAAFQRAIDSGHPDAAPRAASNLGLLREEQGDSDGAEQAYQQAIDSRYPEQASATAAVNLGVLLAKHGKVDGAVAAYQQAIDSGHPDLAPMAAVNLGMLLEDRWKIDGAEQAYQQAIDSGHAGQAPWAAVSLGLLLAEHGKVDGAVAVYQQAIDSGHADATPAAAVNRGVLLAVRGDLYGAVADFQRAIDSGHADLAPMAAVNLGVLLAEHGKVDGAVAAYQQAINSGHTDHAPMAADYLQEVLQTLAESRQNET